jgi:hypothetical protein
VTKIDPVSVECPSCGAAVGDRCWSGTRRGRKLTRGSHPDRVRAARGEDVPENFSAFLRREIRRVEDEVLARKKT